ncbi:hypothetical protein Tco_1146228 [Tanacetum coccineum]
MFLELRIHSKPVALLIIVVVVLRLFVVVGRPILTVLGRMCQPLAVTALGWSKTIMIVITLEHIGLDPAIWLHVTIACSVGWLRPCLYSDWFLNCFLEISLFFLSFLPDVQRRHGSFILSSVVNCDSPLA